MSEVNVSTPVDDPTFGLLRISPDGRVLAEELEVPVKCQGQVWQPGDYFVTVRGVRVYYTTAQMNPEIADWPKLKVAE